jgi:DNA polymerase III sliding clamp (beta) subunit (PCNA family)
VELEVNQIQRALQAVSGACNARHQSEILQHVLLRATAHGVQVVASDGEVTAIAVVTPESVRPETVPALEILLPQKFVEIVKQLDGEHAADHC